MRKADIDHAWQECRKDDRAQLSLSGFHLDVEGVCSEFSVKSRVTGFIGPNGAGKTSFFLNLLAAFLNSESSYPLLVKINGRFRGKDFSIEPGKVSPPLGLIAEYIDVSSDVHVIRKHFNAQSNFHELLPQFEPNFPNSAQLGLYKHVCGRAYDSLSVIELDAPIEPSVIDSQEGGEDVVFPFFQVVVGAIKYSSQTMGFGELCACYLLWRLNRAAKGTVILLDEPDSHLSPASRRGLIDAIAILAKERELWVGFTTHSLELLESLKEDEIYLISSDIIGNPPTILPIVHRRHAVRSLGLSLQRRLLIVVEDVDAQAAVWCMINKWGSDIARLVDVQIVSGGATEVMHFIMNFPSTRICGAIAILDGDKMKSMSGIDNVLFLPSVNDPIDSARAQALKNCLDFANFLGVDSVELNKSLIKIAHVNHHDFLAKIIEVQNIEGKNVQDVRIALLNSWLIDPVIADDAKELIKNLTEIVDRIR